MYLGVLGADIMPSQYGSGGEPFFVKSNVNCPPGHHQQHEGRGVMAVNRCTPYPKAPPVIYTPPPPAPTPPPVITVAPVMQQAFTPQFSPTMQQQQDSPGASQAASPEQRVFAPQVAEPQISIPSYYIAPPTAAPPATPPIIAPTAPPAPAPIPAPIPVTIPVSTAPSGDSAETIALREELERLRIENLIREMTPPEIGTDTLPPITPQAQNTTGMPLPVGLPSYNIPSTVPYKDVEEKTKMNPWLVGGGLLLLAMIN